jgi:hypothetical protein
MMANHCVRRTREIAGGMAVKILLLLRRDWSCLQSWIEG